MSSKSSSFGKVILTQSRPTKRPRKRGSGSGSGSGNGSGGVGAGAGTTTRIKENIPSLQEFMHRQTVMTQYRQFFRAMNTVDDKNSSASMKNEVRTAFKSLIHEEDKLSIKMALKEVNIEYFHLSTVQVPIMQINPK